MDAFKSVDDDKIEQKPAPSAAQTPERVAAEVERDPLAVGLAAWDILPPAVVRRRRPKL